MLNPVAMLFSNRVIVFERMLLVVFRSRGSNDCIVSVASAVEALTLAVRAEA